MEAQEICISLAQYTLLVAGSVTGVAATLIIFIALAMSLWGKR